MSDEGSDDKQYAATEKKLQDAREKGEIAKSVDLVTAAGYAGFLIAALGMGAAQLSAFGLMLQGFLDDPDHLAAALLGNGAPVAGAVIGGVVAGNWAWFALPAALALLAILGQQAFVVASDRIVPKLSRISPLAGIKNKFGRNGLFEFAKSFFKLLIYGAVLGIFLALQRDTLLSSVYLAPPLIVARLLELSIVLCLIVVAVSAVIGVVDLVWQRAEHQRKHRMSRKEMMDEMKQAEGDPELKQKRRQRGFDLATNRMLNDVPTADVVIVNPTHYAVALKWSRATGSAPVCVAKGTDEVAARIREQAMLHGVPVHADAPTARALHAAVDIGDEIAPEHYAAVAAAIRFAEKVRRTRV